MKILEVIEHGVAVLILSIFVFTILMAGVNCIAPMPKDEQRARMEPTVEMYRAFNLNPSTVRRHNADMTNQALAQYTDQARGGR